MKNLFEYYFETNQLHFKYAKGRPAVEDREYHDYNEIVFFMEGKSFFISKNIQQKLTCGSIVIIPKEHFHQFCVSEPESYVRCILGFYEDKETQNIVRRTMNTIKIMDMPNKQIASIFKSLTEIAESNLSDDEKCIFVHGSLMQLLVYFKKCLSETISSNVILSPVVSRTLDIIDERYAEKLSVEDIAKQLFVSSSTLAHKFSKEMNIPIYQYITKRRLAEVNKLVRSGENISKAAQKSGFNDYSGFYRLYKKYYNK